MHKNTFKKPKFQLHSSSLLQDLQDKEHAATTLFELSILQLPV